MLDNFSEISFVIPAEFLWGILSVFLLFFLIVSIMLNHHWKYYGIKDNPKVFTKTIYWIVSLILIFIILVALLIYESN